MIGVDPGRTGAIALIRNDTSASVWDMPHSDQRGIDLRAVKDIVDEIYKEAPNALVGLEYNTGMTGEMPDLAFRFGLQTGQLEALFYAWGFSVKRISSNLWTGRLGLPGKRQPQAIPQRAAYWDRLYPNHGTMIRGPRGGILDGRLDSLLICHWLRSVEKNPCGMMGARRRPKSIGTADPFLDL